MTLIAGDQAALRPQDKVHLQDRLPTLRAARSDDIGELARLLRRSWLATIAPHLPRESRERFEATDPAGGYCRAMWSEFVVAELEGVPVGMRHAQGDLIAAIHVNPPRKRQGIGRQLMADAEQEIGRGCRRARLEVLAFNEGALRFYEALGWREAGRTSGEEMGSPVELVEMRLGLGDRSDAGGGE